MCRYGILFAQTLSPSNSSSGLNESTSLRIPVVNIGDRQKGRIKEKNIIDVGYTVEDIKSGIKKACSKEFTKGIKDIKNPYDMHEDGKVSHRIKEKLKTIELSEDLIKKSFYDIEYGVRDKNGP